jgi:segregation and condensation protein B
MSDHKRLLEAALFISSRPLMLDDLAKILGVSSLGYVKGLLQKLQKDYDNKAIELFKIPEGWQFQVKPQYLPRVSKLTPYADISEGGKRTLAIIAYKEPIMQSEIIRMQGNKAYSYIKALMKMNLISAKKTNRTKILTLTQEFERYFGEEKKRIKERMDAQMNKTRTQPAPTKRAEEQTVPKPDPVPGQTEEEPPTRPEPEKPAKSVKERQETKNKPKQAKPVRTEKKQSKSAERKAKPRNQGRKVTISTGGDSNVEKTAQPIEELVL